MQPAKLAPDGGHQEAPIPVAAAANPIRRTPSHRPYARQSTPARLRSAYNHQHACRPATLCSGVDGQQNDGPVTPDSPASLDRRHRYRHSAYERSRSSIVRPHNHHRHHHAHHLLAVGAHSPSHQHSPTSAESVTSTASDSAFSRSQSTLEGSDSSDRLSTGKRRHRHCFKNLPLKGSFCSDRVQSSGDDSSSDLSSLSQENEFRIIWRNLKYKIPEKRFSRVRAFIASKRESLFASSDTDAQTGEEPPGPDRDGGPPTRAPVAGKPRDVIFSGLNGCIKSGQLTAILGPSGAGKTTFLKCLTNTIEKGVSGSIDIVGTPSTSHLKLCIIPQKDFLFDNLTVMENLLFASRIKNTEPELDHMQNVEHVTKLLGLQSCLKLKTSKLSGGQYKRVSIAQELLSKPDILILDEPTSGLDSLTCLRTVSVLRDLVDMSRAGMIPPLAIVMTIHQPQIKIFDLFHRVYILSSNGQCVYEGRPEYILDTVAHCCNLLPPPDDMNPASFIIDLASEAYGTEPIEQLTKLQLENFQVLHSPLERDLREVEPPNIDGSVKVLDGNLTDLGQPKLFSNPKHDSSSVGPESLEVGKLGVEISNYLDPLDDGQLKISDRLRRRNNHERNFWAHTWLLIKRLWMSMLRDPLLATTRISFHLIIPFVFYVIYSQKSGSANACPHIEREFDLQTMTSQENIQRLEKQHDELILTFENVSLFFLLLYSFSMCVLAVTALSFPLNMQILLKETTNGWYSMPRFVMAKTLADLPMELTMPMISVSIAYVLTGQPSSYLCWRMLTVTAVMTLCSLISQTQGLLFGAYFMNNVQAAVFISQASSLPWILLSGFTTRVSELPTLLRWLSFGSIYRLGIESIVAVRYGFGMCPCDRELVDETPAKMVGIPDQLRSVMRYYMDMYSEDSSKNSTGDIFEKIASTLSRANTYGVDIVSCHDVRPFILSAREVDEGTLPTFLLILISIFFGLKILLFCVVRFRTG